MARLDRHAMRLMTHHRVRHLLVVDDGELVGIIRAATS
ncbi:MAG TPA: CBS domain-containing protein [Rhizomicrobium sp.]|nr:CBS domain-containing protein [Rhizomicrobium sp.]